MYQREEDGWDYDRTGRAETTCRDATEEGPAIDQLFASRSEDDHSHDPEREQPAPVPPSQGSGLPSPSGPAAISSAMTRRTNKTTQYAVWRAPATEGRESFEAAAGGRGSP